MSRIVARAWPGRLMVSALAGVLLTGAEAKAQEPDMRRTQVSVSVHDTWGAERFSIRFATLPEANPPEPGQRHQSYRIVRFEQIDGDARTVRWADSRTCEAVDEALHRLSQLPQPRIRSPLVPVEGSVPVPLRSLHGHVFEIQTWGMTPENAMVTLTMRADAGEIAAWGIWMLNALSACTPADLGEGA